jgi:hypothetical protein
MACLKRLFILFLFSSFACAQYILVYAKLTDGAGNVSKTAYLHFELKASPPHIPAPSPIAAIYDPLKNTARTAGSA